jgi:hypothetical protein
MLAPITIVIYTQIRNYKNHFSGTSSPNQKGVFAYNTQESKPKHNVHKITKMHKHKKIIKTHKKQGVGISNCQK